MLMHHADAESRSVVRSFISTVCRFAYLAFLRLIQAEESTLISVDLPAPFCEQSMYRPLAELQRNIVVCDYSGKFPLVMPSISII